MYRPLYSSGLKIFARAKLTRKHAYKPFTPSKASKVFSIHSIEKIFARSSTYLIGFFDRMKKTFSQFIDYLDKISFIISSTSQFDRFIIILFTCLEIGLILFLFFLFCK